MITSPRSCEGYADGGQFCGLPTHYKVYFYAEFDADCIEKGTWKKFNIWTCTISGCCLILAHVSKSLSVDNRISSQAVR